MQKKIYDFVGRTFPWFAEDTVLKFSYVFQHCKQKQVEYIRKKISIAVLYLNTAKSFVRNCKVALVSSESVMPKQIQRSIRKIHESFSKVRFLSGLNPDRVVILRVFLYLYQYYQYNVYHRCYKKKKVLCIFRTLTITGGE